MPARSTLAASVLLCVLASACAAPGDEPLVSGPTVIFQSVTAAPAATGDRSTEPAPAAAPSLQSPTGLRSTEVLSGVELPVPDGRSARAVQSTRASSSEAAPAHSDDGPDDAPDDAPSAPTVLPFTPLLFVVAPGASLLGVPLGADADDAVAELRAQLGDPDRDSGWYRGCPLDGLDDDERLVQWGDLNVYFETEESSPTEESSGVFTAWGIDLRVVEGGLPDLDLVILPGEATLGDPIDQVAEAAELEVVYDARLDVNRVGLDGFEILAGSGPGAASWGAFVPSIPVCGDAEEAP